MIRGKVMMNKDSEIGRVVAVDTAEVTVQLSRDLKGLTRSTYEGAHEVGRINSYVIVPVGAARLVAIVTRVVMVEEAEVSSSRTMISFPTAKRILKATLIGTIEGGEFTQGVAQFPILDSAVHLPEKRDLSAIFDERQRSEDAKSVLREYCLPIGKSPLFPEFEINIDPDKAFGKHTAVIGSTGSGKSCTIAAMLQTLLQLQEVAQTNIVILDTNGEYRAAFHHWDSDHGWEPIANSRCLYIPSGPKQQNDGIAIPYWFLNVDDFVALFRAAPNVQKPVLLEALRSARGDFSPESREAILHEKLMNELHTIITLASGDGIRVSKDIRSSASGLHDWVEIVSQEDAWAGLLARIPEFDGDDLLLACNEVAGAADEFVSSSGFPEMIPINKREEICERLEPFHEMLLNVSVESPEGLLQSSADAPSYFDISRFRTVHIENVLRREETGSRAREYVGSMLLRMDRLLQDPRFDFLFGKEGERYPKVAHSLATFLRDILGLASPDEDSVSLSAWDETQEGILPFYDRQRMETAGHNIVVVDLSLLASEVLENVTALIGRLVLELLQRIGEEEGMRGKLPVVLVLEEAQNYIREQAAGPDMERQSVSKEVFERIAREGRKYGLGLVVASQRPSELSKTVLAQCSSFVVHRLQNPEDLRYFRQIVPGIFESLLDQLPALAPQTALLLGEFVRAPVLARIMDANPLPASRDPEFMEYWQSDSPLDLPIERIAARWEAGDLATDQSGDSGEEE